ncbi:MAG: hypothetical protein IPF66_25010 [Holophagales bacterium]|nr:hypothetical protein [Holophagales bacterium]
MSSPSRCRATPPRRGVRRDTEPAAPRDALPEDGCRDAPRRELGTLLKVETLLADEIRKANAEYNRQKKTTGYLPGFELPPTQGELDFSQIDDETFFDRAEELLLAALRRFAESAAGAAGVRRRLFAGDAAQGIALIELVRTKFDVVLMNPPFGACGMGAKKEFEKAYARTKNDLYAAFVERGVELLRKRGMLGAITSRTGFFLSSFRSGGRRCC